LTPGANKNVAPLHTYGSTGCAGCRHKTQFLNNTKQKVYFDTNIFIKTIVIIYIYIYI